jgi:hypothetical protein
MNTDELTKKRSVKSQKYYFPGYLEDNTKHSS